MCHSKAARDSLFPLFFSVSTVINFFHQKEQIELLVTSVGGNASYVVRLLFSQVTGKIINYF